MIRLAATAATAGIAAWVSYLYIAGVAARYGAASASAEHGLGLGKLGWVIEQTFVLLHWFRRLHIR